MSDSARYQWIIVLAAAVIFFTNLGAAALWDMDEALYASCAREMLERKDLIVPWFNGRLFPEKPPLMFWTMMLGFQLCGVNEWGARLFSPIMGIAAALVVFRIGRLLYDLKVGFLAGLITVSTVVFTISARAATIDAALTLATVLMMYFFLRGWQASSLTEQLRLAGSNSASHSLMDLPSTLGMYVSLGVAVLAKGPVGALLPVAAIGAYLFLTEGRRGFLPALWRLRPLTGLLITALVALPWYVLVTLRTEGQWLRVFLLEFNLRPFKQPILGHGEVGLVAYGWRLLLHLLYYFYHLPALLVGFFPWSVFLGPTFLAVYYRIRAELSAARELNYASPRSRLKAVVKGSVLYADSFCMCWFGVWLLFWSICKTKLPHYLLPAYPALALVMSAWLGDWLSETRLEGIKKRLNPFSPTWLRNAWLSLILAGAGILIVVPIVAAYYLPQEGLLGLVGAVPLAAGIGCWVLSARERRASTVWLFILSAIVFLVGVFGFAALRVDRHQNAKRLVAAVQADWPRFLPGDKAREETRPATSSAARPPLAAVRFFRESFVFYGGYPIVRCDDDAATGRTAIAALSEFFSEAEKSKSPVCYVITTDEYENELLQAFSGTLQPVWRDRRFLAFGEVVVFRRLLNKLP